MNLYALKDPDGVLYREHLADTLAELDEPRALDWILPKDIEPTIEDAVAAGWSVVPVRLVEGHGE